MRLKEFLLEAKDRDEEVLSILNIWFSGEPDDAMTKSTKARLKKLLDAPGPKTVDIIQKSKSAFMKLRTKILYRGMSLRKSSIPKVGETVDLKVLNSWTPHLDIAKEYGCGGDPSIAIPTVFQLKAERDWVLFSSKVCRTDEHMYGEEEMVLIPLRLRVVKVEPSKIFDEDGFIIHVEFENKL